jgi:L-2,4-diaminobutyrate transaminase
MEAGTATVGAFSHGYTYSGHPISAAAANAVLDIVERENLPQQAASTGAYLLDRLHQTFDDLPITAEVRGVGMMAAVEFVADPATKRRFDPVLNVGPRISKAARDRGVIVRAMPNGDILGFAPPLITSRADIDLIVEVAGIAAREVVDQLVREGVLNA